MIFALLYCLQKQYGAMKKCVPTNQLCTKSLKPITKLLDSDHCAYTADNPVSQTSSVYRNHFHLMQS